MNGEPTVLVERHGAVALVTLNRPEAMNALSRDLRVALAEAMIEHEASSAKNAAVSGAEVEERRRAVMERGRSQLA